MSKLSTIRCPIIAVAAILSSATLPAQVPVTELFQFELTRGDSGKWHAHSPRLLSAFNPGGYTNQPEYISTDRILVSVRKKGDNQNDICELDLSSGRYSAVTDTPEGEYSPTLLPDGRHFSCIREVTGDEVDQQLFIYPVDRSDNGWTVDSELRNVGYHTWLNEELLGLFLVGDSSKLGLYDMATGKLEIFASKIGRAVKTTPDGKLAFVHKYGDSSWYLKLLDPVTKTTEILIQTPAGSEDFTVSADGHFFTGQGGILYVYHPDSHDDWQPVGDLSMFGVEKITRLAINERNQLLVVSNRS